MFRELGNRSTLDMEVEGALQKLVVERLLSCISKLFALPTSS